MSLTVYDSPAMPPVNRRRKPRSVTLNPVLVDEVLSIGRESGEENLSRLLDEAMRAYIRQHRRENPPPGDKPKAKGK